MAEHLNNQNRKNEKDTRWLIPVAACAAFLGITLVVKGVTAEPEPTPVPVFSIVFSAAEGAEENLEVQEGDTVTTQQPAPVEGQFFCGWRDSTGILHAPGEQLTVLKDESYTAEYAVQLEQEQHLPYLFAREDGLYHPEETLKKGDISAMLQALAPTAEVPEYGEEETLQPVSPGELRTILTAFIPFWEQEQALAPLDTEAESISRGDFAVLMNGLLNRVPEQLNEEVTGILPECSPDDPLYAALCEAVLSHEYEGTGRTEKWTAAQAPEPMEEGMHVIGGILYCLDETGHFVKDSEVDGFQFDENGAYTSGDPELDELVSTVLEELYSPDYTDEEQLRAVYDYVTGSFQYLRRDYYDFGDSTYAPAAAKIMLSTGKGNCYNYAGTFCMLTRALGFPTKVYSGTVGVNRDPHGWCDICIDGTDYIFDTELQMKVPRQDFFMKTYIQLRRWNYTDRKNKRPPY